MLFSICLDNRITTVYLQQGYKKLREFIKYKKIVAYTLLVLYMFIAIPIQLWHDHENIDYALSAKLNKAKQSVNISIPSQNAADADCQICSHHYSIFTEAKEVVYQLSIPAFQTIEPYYVFSLPPSPLSQFSNKGPPYLS